jgi:SAM-dependent methyltransferase
VMSNCQGLRTLSKISSNCMNWSTIQSPEEMEVYRRFEYNKDSLALIKKWLKVGGHTRRVAEIGSGSGYFTEKLLQMLPRVAEVTCVEPDNRLRDYAREQLGRRAKFLKGQIEHLPLPDEYADLTVCHIVLSNIADPESGLREMYRVTARGGVVGVIEPASYFAHVFPDKGMTLLARRVEEASWRGVWDLRRQRLGIKDDLADKEVRMERALSYVNTLRKIGMDQIEVHGVLLVFLLSDPNRPLESTLEWLKERLGLLKRYRAREKRYLLRGGLTFQEVREWFRLYEAYLKRLIIEPSQIKQSHELEVKSRFVTTGTKPAT